MENFKTVYYKTLLTTIINENGEEKKNFIGLHPCGYTKPDFYDREDNIDHGFGGSVRTGKVNGITVIDCDTMESYYELCRICPDMHKFFTVSTRRGRHIYFKYNPCVIKLKIADIDTKNDGGNGYVVAINTPVKRVDGTAYIYKYKFGNILPIPDCIRNLCEMKNNDYELKDFTTNIDYEYDISDELMRDILDKLQISHPEYFNDYSLWLKLTTVMKTCNKFDIWDEYSKLYSGYDARQNLKIWKGIKIKIGINFFCKLLGMPYVRYHKVVNENDLKKKAKDLRIVDVNQKYISLLISDFDKAKVLIMESGTGTGKTTCVAKNIKMYQEKEMNVDITILSITNLISLANQQRVTFNKNGVELYSYQDDNINPSLLMCKNSVICINSLHKLANCDFKDKIIYIDEIHALTKTLTHNKTLGPYHILIINTLMRALKECHKVIVSDAHIYNNTLHLLDGIRTVTHFEEVMYFRNKYNKFQDVEAIQINDENNFYNMLLEKVIKGIPFSFCSDSKKVITEWYNYLWCEASLETRDRMVLFTGEMKYELCDDWSDKMIFYSPTISTGVDITILDQTSQFVHIKGCSVDSIQLYQMSTRTRNMSELYYYSCAKSKKSEFDNILDCETKMHNEFVVNKLGRSSLTLDQELIVEANEKTYFKMYCENQYQKDLYHTNILHFYQQELKKAGFTLSSDEDRTKRLNTNLAEEIEALTEEINNTRFDELIEAFDKSGNYEVSDQVEVINKRVKILKLDSKEMLKEYDDVIKDEYMFEDFMNYSRLNKSRKYCDMKLEAILNTQMLNGIQNNVWNKIKYIHMLAEYMNIPDNLFDLENIQMIDVNDKDVVKLIETIKTLYRKRDKTVIKNYTMLDVMKLYKFMLDGLIKNLKLIESSRVKKNSKNNTRVYSINQKLKERYDVLIEKMNTKIETPIVFYVNMDNEEE